MLCVLLVCLSVLGAYAVQGTLKSEYNTDHTTAVFNTENNQIAFIFLNCVNVSWWVYGADRVLLLKSSSLISECYFLHYN